MAYYGDYKKGVVVFLPFNTSSSTGDSIDLATNGTAKAYINGGTTEITAGVTLVENHDGITGRHGVTVDTSGGSFTVGSDVDVCIDGAVIDGRNVNSWVGKFSIERASIVNDQATAIKAKTDSLTFTTGGQVDANVQSINDVALTGNGSSPKFGV